MTVSLENTTVIRKYESFIAKCESYYKMGRLLQIATIKNDKEVVFKNYDCTSETNNTQIDNVIIPMYNLIGYSDKYSKASGSLWQYYRDEPVNDSNDDIVDFRGNSTLLKCKQKITGTIVPDSRKDFEIRVPLRYLNNFGEILKCLYPANISTADQRCFNVVDQR